MPHKLKLLESLMRNTKPLKFSGCGYNAIPKNMHEYEKIHINKTFHRVNELKRNCFEKFEKNNSHQDQTLKYYQDNFKET